MLTRSVGDICIWPRTAGVSAQDTPPSLQQEPFIRVIFTLLALYPRIDTVLYLFPFLPAERAAAMALRLMRFPIGTLAAVAAAGPRGALVEKDPRQYDGVPHGPPVFRVGSGASGYELPTPASGLRRST